MNTYTIASDDRFPDLNGLWKYMAPNGTARIQQNGSRLTIYLHWLPRKKNGEKEPHYTIGAKLRYDEQNQLIIEGSWQYNGKVDFNPGRTTNGSLAGVADSDSVTITTAQSQGSHGLAGIRLERLR
jgi:hypothetical protein